MFDLDQAIAAWRAQIQSSSAVTTSAGDEMEDHLRSAAGDLAKSGLSSEEAFLVATRRLGAPSELDAEHDKVVEPGRRRELRWMLVGVVLAALLPSAARLAGKTLSFVAVLAGATSGPLTYIGPTVGLMLLAIPLLRLARSASLGTGALTRLVDGGTLGAAAAVLGILVALRTAEAAVNFGLASSLTSASVADPYRALTMSGMLTGTGLAVMALVLLAWPRWLARPSQA